MEPRELEVGDIVQLNGDNDQFSFKLLIVTEPKKWGCQGYVLSSEYFEATRFKGKAYLRPTFSKMEYIGQLKWICAKDLLEYEE